MLDRGHWPVAKGTDTGLIGAGIVPLQNRDHDSGDVSAGCETSRIRTVAILTPTHATLVPALFRNGTMCLPLVIVLSMLGLKASPEKNVRMSGCPANRGCEQ